MNQQSTKQLAAGLEHIRRAPRDRGALQMIVRRPDVGQREPLQRGVLDVEEGLVGDNWHRRGSRHTDDGLAHPDMQLNIMNSRVAELVSGSRERWELAGDQLFVDMDLSDENLPPGTQLELGTALLEVTAVPHLGCKKFVARYGLDAMKFVNSGRGKQLNLRGINARVLRSGTVSVGDELSKVGH